ncbi:MscS Mechanosensitive ion channel [Burkholderia cenocepacia PC184]|nr:MscS Mechanosensitive ion channel [Burkholderia cenocepacia PC184]
MYSRGLPARDTRRALCLQHRNPVMFLDHLHPERWTFLWNALSTLSLKLAAGLALLVAGWWLSKRIGNWLNRLLSNKERVDDTLRPILCDVAVWGIRIVAIVGALSQLGIETASIVAVLGAAGLAIGLALQGTMQNIAAGIMLLLSAVVPGRLLHPTAARVVVGYVN